MGLGSLLHAQKEYDGDMILSTSTREARSSNGGQCNDTLFATADHQRLDEHEDRVSLFNVLITIVKFLSFLVLIGHQMVQF